MALQFTQSSRSLRLINTFQTDGYGVTSGGAYLPDPYVNTGTFAEKFPASRLALVLNTGFDGFRWVIDPATLCTAATDALLDQRIAIVIGHLETLVAAGLKVIANLHVLSASPVPGWGNLQIVDGIGQPKWERFVYCALRFATAIEARRTTTLPTTSVAFEPMNEPGFMDWAPFMKDLYQRLRPVLPQHTIVLCGRDYSSVVGLCGMFPGSTYGLNPADFGNDPNVLYTFHGYEANAVALQNFAYYQDIHRLTYPPAAHPGGKAQAIADFTAAATAAGRQSTIADLTSQGNAHGIDYYFDHPTYSIDQVNFVGSWADAHGISRKQIINGEFGAGGDSPTALGATLASRAAFQNAKIAAGDAAGYGGWVLHELNNWGGGFGLALNEPPFPFTPELIPTSLGVTMPKTLTAANVAFGNVGGGTYTVRTQLLDAASAVVAQGSSAAVVVPADPAPVPNATTPTVTVS